jgi:hypothetical protein
VRVLSRDRAELALMLRVGEGPDTSPQYEIHVRLEAASRIVAWSVSVQRFPRTERGFVPVHIVPMKVLPFLLQAMVEAQGEEGSVKPSPRVFGRPKRVKQPDADSLLVEGKSLRDRIRDSVQNGSLGDYRDEDGATVHISDLEWRAANYIVAARGNRYLTLRIEERSARRFWAGELVPWRLSEEELNQLVTLEVLGFLAQRRSR